jgi:hypothetical protein
MQCLNLAVEHLGIAVRSDRQPSTAEAEIVIGVQEHGNGASTYGGFDLNPGTHQNGASSKPPPALPAGADVAHGSASVCAGRDCWPPERCIFFTVAVA